MALALTVFVQHAKINLMDTTLISADISQKIGAGSDSKLNAAADFTTRLVKGPAGAVVARVYLFGSVAHHEARPESDVDVMVFVIEKNERISEWIAQAAWDASADWGEQVAQLVFPASGLFQPRSYLIYDTVKRAKELYAMEDEKIRRLEAEGLFRKAERYLEQAQRAAGNGDYELAAVGGYNTAELIARALVLLKSDVGLPSSPGGVIRIFSREYIKKGEAPADWGRLLNQALVARSHALYDIHEIIDYKDTQPVLALAQAMLDFLDQKLT